MERVIEKFWKCVELVLHLMIYKILRIELREEAWNGLVQFVKFGIVGLMNNVISYMIYLILVSLGMHYTPANIIGFTVSVFNSYYWNNKYVFASNDSRVWWKTFIKTYISYAGTGIILSNIMLFIWIDGLGVSTIIAPLINLVITVPINFLVNKLWAYRK
jgi:putative flippase GtrA